MTVAVVRGEDERRQLEEGKEEGGERRVEERKEEEEEEEEEGFDKFKHLAIDDGEPKTERPKLAEGFYEIEAVRKKMIRKGELQYLIKCLGSGKYKSSRRRRHGISHTLPKKQCTSPAIATYDIPAVKVRIIEEPLPMLPLDDSSSANVGERNFRGVNNVEISKQARENVFGEVPLQIEEMKGENELNMKLSELEGTMGTLKLSKR